MINSSNNCSTPEIDNMLCVLAQTKKWFDRQEIELKLLGLKLESTRKKMPMVYVRYAEGLEQFGRVFDLCDDGERRSHVIYTTEVPKILIYWTQPVQVSVAEDYTRHATESLLSVMLGPVSPPSIFLQRAEDVGITIQPAKKSIFRFFGLRKGV